MRANPVKQKLAAGGTALGTMVFEFSSPGLPALLVAAGAEFALYDMEHSGFTMAEMRQQFSYCRGLGLVPIVRPPADRSIWPVMRPPGAEKSPRNSRTAGRLW